MTAGLLIIAWSSPRHWLSRRRSPPTEDGAKTGGQTFLSVPPVLYQVITPLR
jgi:hypothetical protein